MTGVSWSVAARPFPTITISTPRLLVRPTKPEDAAGVVEVFSDRKSQRWLRVPQNYGVAEAYRWCGDMAVERRDHGDGDHYAIVRRGDERLVGCIWISRTDWGSGLTEVSVAIAPTSRGYGIAGEAIDALLLALVREHGFQRVELRVASGNSEARRVARKAGFTYEGRLRNASYVHSGRVDVEVWSFVVADLR